MLVVDRGGMVCGSGKISENIMSKLKMSMTRLERYSLLKDYQRTTAVQNIAPSLWNILSHLYSLQQSIKFTIFYERGSWPPQTITKHQRSPITDDHSKHDNNENFWNIAGITEMWHRAPQREQMLLEKMVLIDLLDAGLPPTFNL